jgi:hypothetical protein
MASSVTDAASVASNVRTGARTTVAQPGDPAAVAAGLTRLKVSASEHPVRQVVVYGDRAEVTRIIAGLPLKFGQNEIVIQHLSQHIAQDSIR